MKGIERRAVAFDENAMVRAAAERLETQAAGAGK